MLFCKNHPNVRIVNVRHQLCDDCNHLRLHGETKYDSNKRKQEKRLKTKKKAVLIHKSNMYDIDKVQTKIPKGKYKIVKVSKHQKEINEKYKETCIKIDNDREPICTGCGLYQTGEIKLSHSHIISRADCKSIGRDDLIYDEKNITFHCMDFGEHIGCHRLWETKVISIMMQLKDCKQNLEYIKSVSKEIYARILNRGQDY